MCVYVCVCELERRWEGEKEGRWGRGREGEES